MVAKKSNIGAPLASKSGLCNRPLGIPVMVACKWQFSALPVLTYLNVHSAPVLETRHFQLTLTGIHPSSGHRALREALTDCSGDKGPRNPLSVLHEAQ